MDSYNLQLLEMAEARLSDSDCSFPDYSDIPLFSQDAEFPPPESVSRVRALVSGSDALWVGSPEYNHSFSGALKNLMDWLSRPVVPGDYSTAVIRGKTVAMSSVAGSSAGSFSLASLTELLTMLSCKIVPCDTRISLGEDSGPHRRRGTDAGKGVRAAALHAVSPDTGAWGCRVCKLRCWHQSQRPFHQRILPWLRVLDSRSMVSQVHSIPVLS